MLDCNFIKSHCPYGIELYPDCTQNYRTGGETFGWAVWHAQKRSELVTARENKGAFQIVLTFQI